MRFIHPENLRAHRYSKTLTRFKGVRALRDYFGPLWSEKLKTAFHQYLLIGLLDE